MELLASQSSLMGPLEIQGETMVQNASVTKEHIWHLPLASVCTYNWIYFFSLKFKNSVKKKIGIISKPREPGITETSVYKVDHVNSLKLFLLSELECGTFPNYTASSPQIWMAIWGRIQQRLTPWMHSVPTGPVPSSTFYEHLMHIEHIHTNTQAKYHTYIWMD